MHGYQLIVELDRLFGGLYEPSTGSVYPAMRALEEEGLVAVERDGRRQVYGLTAAGREALHASGERIAAFELRTSVRLRSNASFDATIDRFAARARALSGRIDSDEGRAVIERAIRDLESLTTKTGAS